MYNLSDLYGPEKGVTTAEESAPEQEEQESVGYASATPVKATASTSGSIWMALIVLFALLWIFNFI